MLRVIGDVHGNGLVYKNIAKKANEQGFATLQLGDMGFERTYNAILEDKEFDLNQNKFFRGNHDCYDYENYDKYPEKFAQFNLGEFGNTQLGGVPFYFVRGAFSIDFQNRTPGVNYFYNEELPHKMFQALIDQYAAVKPSIMITHECPDFLGKGTPLKTDWILKEFGFDPLTFNTRTGLLLQHLYEIHQPDLWVFGHYHKKWEQVAGPTRFICVPELDSVDIESK